MRTLHELPRFSDRWSYLYLEEGRLNVDAMGLKFSNKSGEISIPIDQLAILMLGPGTVVTHRAVTTLADNNCLLAWTGAEGNRLYASGKGGTFSARRIILQASLVSDQRSREAVARRMYRFRFNTPPPEDVSMPQIRGFEGARVRRIYAEMSDKYSVPWRGRKYDPHAWNSADLVNRCLSMANSCLYGVCHAAILSAGYSPALGFIHTGKMLSFVYDIADLYKAELSIPVAFDLASHGPPNIGRAVRIRCRDAFHQFKLMERILPDIAEVLNAGDDLREQPSEFEGRIVTVAD
ncbi:MAG: type I-E CRISPR-associated endonuclease Cas1e [Chloroflexi bacterium]|nr:type I-E CRISPR-associated endonuclease Cas1e [Chloroflexota bacterium]